jgi:hypothetical protein
MSLVSKLQNKIIGRILEECTIYLYSGKKEIATFAVIAGSILRCNDDAHTFETKENHYDNDLIIIKFCLTCGSCYGEVMPSHQKVIEQ